MRLQLNPCWRLLAACCVLLAVSPIAALAQCPFNLTGVTPQCLFTGAPTQLQSTFAAPNSPYGTVVIPTTVGQFMQGDLLVSGWNDPANNTQFGQGNQVIQIRGGAILRTITVSNVPDECVEPTAVGGNGLGFTMAMAYVGRGFVMQCSTPISPNQFEPNTNGTTNPPFPGCCLVLDHTGTVVASFRGNGINGPWGATSVVRNDVGDDGDVNPLIWNNVPSSFFTRAENENGDNGEQKQTTCTLFISMVLGPDGNVLGTNNGQVMRYTFTVPSTWQSGSNASNPGSIGTGTTVLSGLTSVPLTINAGTVGPSGLAIWDGKLLVADTQGAGSEGQPGSGQLLSIEHAEECNPCTSAVFAACTADMNQCNNPIGVNWSPANSLRRGTLTALLVANGGDGNLVQYDPTGATVCTFVGDASGGGTLFNLLAVPAGVGHSFAPDRNCTMDSHVIQLAYVDDASNNVFFMAPVPV